MRGLKDMVLETLAKMDVEESAISLDKQVQNNAKDRDILSASLIDEREFLSLQREKLLVLFEGLRSPDIQNIDQKLELVLRYLQYQLSEIDKRLQEI